MAGPHTARIAYGKTTTGKWCNFTYLMVKRARYCRGLQVEPTVPTVEPAVLKVEPTVPTVEPTVLKVEPTVPSVEPPVLLHQQ